MPFQLQDNIERKRRGKFFWYGLGTFGFVLVATIVLTGITPLQSGFISLDQIEGIVVGLLLLSLGFFPIGLRHFLFSSLSSAILLIMAIDLISACYTKFFLPRQDSYAPIAGRIERLNGLYKDFLGELEQSNVYRYQAYTIWKRKSFKGSFINIDEQGIRLTSSANPTKTSSRLFCFGGSTMWGTGVRDSMTIPSLLQQRSNESGSQFKVTNFGESGYVSTQELIALTLTMAEGKRPDIVVSLNGINDIYAAYQSGSTGYPENFDRISARFRFDDLIDLKNFARHLSIVENFRLLVLDEQLPRKTYATMAVSAAELAKAIVERYLKTVAIIASQAKASGFSSRFFIQPLACFGSKPLTEQERTIVSSLDPKLIDLYRKTYDLFSRLPEHNENIIFLGDVFAGHHEELWLDHMHLGNAGNRIIAEKIFETLQKAAIRTDPVKTK